MNKRNSTSVGNIHNKSSLLNSNTKPLHVVIKQWVTNIHTEILEDAVSSDLKDDLYKACIKTIPYFMTITSQIPQQDIKKSAMPVVFTSEKNLMIDELKTSTLQKVVTCINSLIADCLKKQTSMTLFNRCKQYVDSIKKFSKYTVMPYDFDKLNDLLVIMNEVSDCTTMHHFEWAMSSLIFHILYTNILSTVVHVDNMMACIEHTIVNNNTKTLAGIYKLKQELLQGILLHIIPKLLSMNCDVISGFIYFKNTKISNPEILIRVLHKYTSNTLTYEDMVHLVINIDFIGCKEQCKPKSDSVSNIINQSSIQSSTSAGTSVDAGGASSGLDKETTENITALANTFLGSSVKDNKPPVKSKNQTSSKMPNNEDMIKILIFKLLEIIKHMTDNYNKENNNTIPHSMKENGTLIISRKSDDITK